MRVLSDNAYAELGLAPGASEIEVKVAWRRLASLWHPDRNPSAAASAKMQRINQALEQIRRAGFASRGADPAAKAAHAPAGDAGDGAAAADESDAAAAAPSEAPGGADARGADSQAASGGESGDGEAPSRTVSRRVKLTLEEAAAGCIKIMRGKLVERCAACDGAGYRLSGADCPECAGAGAVRQRSWYGWFGTSSECTACQGDGIERLACSGCAGTGKLPARDYRVDVRIPHGVRDGDLLHAGGRKPRPGHFEVRLDLHIEILPHALFELAADGCVHCEVPVDGFAWIANRTIEVPTLSGLQDLQLDREQLLYRLSGQGFPAERRGARGDQLVRVQPVFPETLSADQDILIDQLVASASSAEASPATRRLADWRQALRAWEKARPRREA